MDAADERARGYAVDLLKQRTMSHRAAIQHYVRFSTFLFPRSF
jgi:hypothetical protein